MSETKQEVFDALLKKYDWEKKRLSNWIDDIGKEVKHWRERYEKAERFGRGHDVNDLYETESQEDK